MEDIAAFLESADHLECPLHWLVGSNEYFPLFRARLEDTDQRDEDVNILLHAAAMSQMNNWRIVRLLIDCGADVNSFNDSANTPLHSAVYSRNLSNVEALLRAGAYVNPTDFYGRTPLHFAVCERYSHPQFPFPISYCDMSVVEKLLLHPGIRVNEVDWMGETPLLWAVRQRNAGAVSVLLRKGADPNIPNRERRTALHVLFSYLRVPDGNIARTLLLNGAGIYCLDMHQLTPVDILLSNIRDQSMRVYAGRCLKYIAFRCNVSESLKSKLIPIRYLHQFLNACCKELALMKRLVISEHGNLHDFALGWLPTELEDPVEEVYRTVVEMLLVFRFKIYNSIITHRLTPSILVEVLKRSLGMPNDFELQPNDTRKSLFREIQRLYYYDERLKMRLQRFSNSYEVI